MSDATCKTCPFWERETSPVGQCRKSEPSNQWILVNRSTNYERIHRWEQRSSWPVTRDKDWCGEHPARKEQG